MPRYNVLVEYHKRHERKLSLLAEDKEEAEKRACSLIETWADVIATNVLQCEKEN